MKHSLQLKLSQHLTLTPQLQQSIRLLQLSTVELNQELERYLAENPLLEREDVPGAQDGGRGQRRRRRTAPRRSPRPRPLRLGRRAPRGAFQPRRGPRLRRRALRHRQLIAPR